VHVKGGKVCVPGVFYSHRADFGTRADQLALLQRLLPPALVRLRGTG